LFVKKNKRLWYWIAVLRARGNDSMELLANDTAAYFQALSETAAAEESRLEGAVAQMADEVNFDD
jgi:hypothetical protein